MPYSHCVFSEEELRLIHIALGTALGLGWDTGALQAKVAEYIKSIPDHSTPVDLLN